MKYFFILLLILLLPACGNNINKKFEKDGEFSLKAEVYIENNHSGVLLLKDWRDRVISAFQVNLSCVTPGIASMPNPMPSIGSYEKSDGGRCYVYIKKYLNIAEADLSAFKTSEPHSATMREILSKEE